MVTEANGGFGRECARHLLSLGLSKLILVVRHRSKAEAIRKSLTTTKTLQPGQTIDVWKLDYASYEDILSFAQRAEASNPHIDTVILNAGIHTSSFSLNSSTKHEETLQTDYLSSVLLMLFLLGNFKGSNNYESNPLLRRIVLVSSDMAALAKFDARHTERMLQAFDDKQSKWDHNECYSTTKLLGQLFVAELARWVPPSLAVINLANPGLCHGSTLSRDLGAVVTASIRILGRSPAVGARSLISAAIEQDESSHGKYVKDRKLRP